MDTNIVFTQLKELLPKVKEIESITVLKEFTELSYKDHEMDVKFEFFSPHILKLTYHGNRFVSIDDEEFDITLGNYTEDAAILDYICNLDFIWGRYVEGKVTNIGKGIKEQVKRIKLKVRKIW